MAVTNLGVGGSALDAQPGSTSGADTNDPLWLGHDGTNYVYLPGVSSNYMSVPDAAALDITGDIDVRAQVALDDWTPSNETHLVGKWGAPGQLSWIFSVAATTGSLILYWSVDGSTFLSRTSTVPVPFLNGERAWVRATLDVNDGGSHTVTFYTSTDKVPKWAVLGAPVTTAGTTSLFSSSSDVEVGTIYGGSYACQQACYRALVYNGIDGTLVLDIDPSVITTGSATSFTATTGQTVTISRWTSGRKAAVVLSSCLLFATDDYLEVPDHPDLDFDADDSFTVLAVHRAWATLGTDDALVAKKANTTATTQGWSLTAGSSTAAQGQGQIGDGTNGTTAVSGSRTSGAVSVVATVRNVTADTLTTYLNGVAGTPVTDPTTGTLANSEVVRVGRLSGAGTEYADMELLAVAVWRRALTAAEIDLVTTRYQARWP